MEDKKNKVKRTLNDRLRRERFSLNPVRSKVFEEGNELSKLYFRKIDLAIMSKIYSEGRLMIGQMQFKGHYSSPCKR